MNSNTHERRRFLGAGAGLAIASFLGLPGKSFASMEEAEAAIATFADGGEVSDSGLTLNTPEIAENGNIVPIAVSVDSPMTEDDYVQSVMIVATDNPNPEVVTFNFSPASGAAQASTRMRLAQTQDVIAVAKLSDGSVRQVSNNIKVTIGGCGG